MNGRKKTLMALAGLLAVALIGGTIAYWNQTATVDNPFDTGKFGSTIVEDFKPSEGENWQPGAEVNKDVLVQNTGDQDIIVRVKLDETWTRKGETAAYKENTAASGAVYTVSQAVADDGLTAADKSVVTKKFNAGANWIKGTDGWYYYKTNVAGGASTDKWLDSVELLNDADMGKQITKWYVTTDATVSDATVWTEYDGLTEKMPVKVGEKDVLHNKVETSYAKDAQNKNLMGYGDSDYTLRVTVQTVQPTQEALDAVYGGGTAFTAPTGTAWTLK